MKKFFLDYGYSSVKMFVNQFAIALFGFSLVIAVSGLENEYSDWLIYVVSGFAVLFYLVLIYSIPWNHGARDRISVDYKKKDKNPYKNKKHHHTSRWTFVFFCYGSSALWT